MSSSSPKIPSISSSRSNDCVRIDPSGSCESDAEGLLWSWVEYLCNASLNLIDHEGFKQLLEKGGIYPHASSTNESSLPGLRTRVSSEHFRLVAIGLAELFPELIHLPDGRGGGSSLIRQIAMQFLFQFGHFGSPFTSQLFLVSHDHGSIVQLPDQQDQLWPRNHR